MAYEKKSSPQKSANNKKTSGNGNSTKKNTSNSRAVISAPKSSGSQKEHASRNTSSAASRSGKNTSNTGRKKAPAVHEKIDVAPPSSAIIHQFIPFFLIVALLFLTACFLLAGVDGAMGDVGGALRNILCGMFGFTAFFIPLILLNLAVYWRKYVDMDMVRWKTVLSAVTLVMISALFHVIFVFKDYSWSTYFNSMFGSNWTGGVALNGGGFIGGIIGGLLRCLTGSVGSLIILISAIALCIMFLFSVTPRYVWTSIRYRMMLWKEKRMERQAQFATEYEGNDDDYDDDYVDDEDEDEDDRYIGKDSKKSGKSREDVRASRRSRRENSSDRRGPVSAVNNDPYDLASDGNDDIGNDALDIDAPFISGTLERESVKGKKNKTESFPELTPSVETPSTAIPLSPPAYPTDPEAEHTAQGTSNPERLLDEIFGPAETTPALAYTDPYHSPSPASASDADVAQSENLEITLTQISDGITGDIHGDVPGVDDSIEENHISLPAEGLDPSVVVNVNTGEVIEDSSANERKKRMEQLAAYIFPSVELLHNVENPSSEDVAAELRSNAQKLMNKLAAFNVHIKKIEYSRGPTITRYELYPEASTRVRSISNLSDDIALELAATVRIEAPIPNKNAVGVEVPNAARAIVFIRELIESEKFRNMPSKLSACLGKDVGGNMIFADIAKMPHLLIAGTTGSGKSVCLNCIILSLLYKARPDEVQFIMIDPKKIEMGMYNKLPHLKVPVVTDMKKAAGTLNAAVNEMEHRYELFEEVNARDLDGYNRAMSMGDPDFIPLPKIVIIIDELADLMMTAPSEIEGSIIRIAQKARAAGIHLIIGTQRPSVNVITGLIKANIPSRIAFSVASGTDSRIIIDITGAEKLIGKGDMLYSPVGALKPARVQGAFVADDEVEAVTNFIKANNNAMEYDSDFMSDIERETERLAAADKKNGGPADDDGESGDHMQAADELFTKALRIAVDNGTIATSFLQRKLSIGFGRAGKIIDRMEALGFVSAANGTKPRNVLLTKQQLMELEMAQDPRVNGNFN